MRRLLLSVAAIAISMSAAFASPVTKQQAILEAQSFLSSTNSGIAKAKRVGSNPQTSMQVAAENSAYYVINVGTNQGFVVVSADDRTESILGYTDSGDFDPNNIPDVLRAILQGYSSEISSLSQNISSKTTISKVRRAPSAPKANINPLFSGMTALNWHQNAPYNANLPVIDNKNVKVGCVALAMTQIMAYNKWPETTAAIPAYTTKSGIHIDAKEPCSFEYDRMLYLAEAVAKVAEYCGAAVEMEYGTGVSTSYSYKAVNAFKTYFGYDQNVRQVSRGAYTVEEWDDLIYNELKNKRPVFYSGVTYKNSGHAFVCDGYKDGLYHFMFGWGYQYNGYFRLQTVHSNATDYGYSFNQDAIIGIQKPVQDSEQLVDSAILTNGTMTLTNGNTFTRTNADEDFKTIKIKNKVYNYLINKYSFDMGLALYQNGKLVNMLTSCKEKLCGSNESMQYTYTFSFGKNIEPGTYQIYPVSRKTGESVWNKDYQSDNYYINAEVTATSLKLEETKKANSLVIDSVNIQDKGVGKKRNVIISVTNNGDDFNGDMYFFANNELLTGDHTPVKANSTDSIVLTYTPQEVGTYSVKLTADKAGKEVLWTGTTTVSTKGTATNTTTPETKPAEETINYTFNFDYKIDEAIHDTILTTAGNTITAHTHFTVTNTSDFDYSTTLTLVKGFTSKKQTETHDISLASGESATFDLDFENLTVRDDDIMSLSVQSNEPKMVINQDYYFFFMKGIVYTDTEGNKHAVSENNAMCMKFPANTTSVDMRNSQTWYVEPSDNPNCLYIFSSMSEVPEGLENSNIIIDGKADNIVIDDKYDFLTPITFEAKQISYTRTFTVGSTGNADGWSTITLPFNVTKVTIDGKDHLSDGSVVGWFHNINDYEGIFWVKKMVNSNGNNIDFDFVEKDEFLANTPYIISVPGNTWGKEWDMTNKPFVFYGENAVIEAGSKAEITGDVYNFVGNTTSVIAEDIYNLNEKGNKFEYQNDPSHIQSFRAYLKTDSDNNRGEALNISSYNGSATTAIHHVAISPSASASNGMTIVYNLSGIEVARTATENISAVLKTLQSGTYLINGKKVIVNN